MKVLITGSDGLLGMKLVKYFEEHFETIPTYQTKINESSIKMDITLKDEVETVIRKIQPNIIVHCAAMTNVDECETNKKQAELVNVTGTKNIAELACENGCKLVYLSTDYIFDGLKGYYKETDIPNPISYYGKSKLKGEEAVKNICKDFIIARSSVLYGWHPVRLNYVTWIISELKKGNKINIVTDQFNSPTLNDNLCEMLLKLIENNQIGIFNTTGGERISRFDFAIKISDIFGLNRNLINPITADQLSWKAKRPKDTSLDTTKIAKFIKPLNIAEGLNRLKNEIEKM
jgi:dTDP-4-dehydrorhamnose reductase